MGKGAVGALVVVDVGDAVEELLELVEGVWWGLAVEPVLHGLLDAFDLAAGAWVVGSAVLLDDAEPVGASECEVGGTVALEGAATRQLTRGSTDAFVR